MAHVIKFTPRGMRELASLQPNIRRRIQEKLRDNAKLPNPLVRAETLTDLPPVTHRFRIGKYRVSFYIENGIVFVERVEIRGRAYRR